MSEAERVAARVGLEALDEALISLGHEPAAKNPDFRTEYSVVGDLPIAVLDMKGVAPLRIIFGLDLNVWVGPYSEVVLLTASEEAKGSIVEVLTSILRSRVECKFEKRSVTIRFTIPGSEPWLRLRVRGVEIPSVLESSYAPYA